MISVLEAAEAIVERREAREGLIPFCLYTYPNYDDAEHLYKIADKLEAVERGEIKRLMIFAPPRHGKTETASIRFGAWYLGRNQQRQVIATSYAESLAYSNSYSVRTTIESPQYQRLWDISLDRSGAIRWQLEGKDNNRASYIAAGVGGGITGEGADLLIIDDPFKNREEAESPVIREKVWSWYRTVARTRLQPDAAVILIMTRWHCDDLAGKLLKQAEENPEADQWEVLHLEAIDENDNALWPGQYPIEELIKIRASIGSQDFTALYQGSPTEAKGNVFKRHWWKYYKARPKFNRLIQVWDTAFKENEENDYSVCALWGETDDGYYLVDVWREKVEFPELKRAVRAAYESAHPDMVIVEDKASGQSIIQELKRGEPGQPKIPIMPQKADTSKLARAKSVTPLIESGWVWLPEYAPWLHDFVEEHSAFPTGSHDDQVDTTSMALGYLSGRSQNRWLPI